MAASLNKRHQLYAIKTVDKALAGTATTSTVLEYLEACSWTAHPDELKILSGLHDILDRAYYADPTRQLGGSQDRSWEIVGKVTGELTHTCHRLSAREVKPLRIQRTTVPDLSDHPAKCTTRFSTV